MRNNSIFTTSFIHTTSSHINSYIYIHKHHIYSHVNKSKKSFKKISQNDGHTFLILKGPERCQHSGIKQIHTDIVIAFQNTRHERKPYILLKAGWGELGFGGM